MNHQVLKYALLLDYPDLCQTQWSYYSILINTAEPSGLQLQRGRQDRVAEHTHTCVHQHSANKKEPGLSKDASSSLSSPL